MHHWSDDDDLIVYCLYRFGNDVFGRDRQKLCDLLGIGFNSLGLKVSNFKFLDGAGGLAGYSQQALRIFNQYSGLPDDEVLQAGNAALQRASDGTITPQSNSDSSLSQEVLEAKRARLQHKFEHLEAQLTRIRAEKDDITAV